MRDLESALKGLRDMLSSKALMNAQRVLILASLYLAGRLGFTELSRLTGVGKDKLEYHIRVLEQEGLVKRRWRFTVFGPRLYIEITQEGEKAFEEVARAIRESGRRGSLRALNRTVNRQAVLNHRRPPHPGCGASLVAEVTLY